MKDISIEHGDSRDLLTRVGEILGSAGVNIEGLCLIVHEGVGIIHLAVEDATTAKQALENSGVKVKSVSEVYVLHKDWKGVTGKPGSFGGICRTLTENGIGIAFGYPAENNRFVFGVNDLSKARALLG